jgi:hypothetical protein
MSQCLSSKPAPDPGTVEFPCHFICNLEVTTFKGFDKLSFLYLSTGDEEKLARMAKIAEHRGDFTSRWWLP